MKIKKIIRAEFLSIKSLKLAKSNPGKTGFVVLFDALFLASVFALFGIANYFAQSIAAGTPSASLLILIILSLMYYLIILFSYSFFKYSVLDCIKSLFEKTEFSFKRLGSFYALNIIIAGVFFAIMIVADYLLASIKIDYRPFVFIFLAIPYTLFLYAFINLSHSLFYEGNSAMETIRKSFKITFTRMKIYRETILIMILFALILWLLFLGSGYLIRIFTLKNYSLYLNAYAYFKQASIIVFDLVFYLAILINRISFYMAIREIK